MEAETTDGVPRKAVTAAMNTSTQTLTINHIVASRFGLQYKKLLKDQ